jgi:hypothetical protein
MTVYSFKKAETPKKSSPVSIEKWSMKSITMAKEFQILNSKLWKNYSIKRRINRGQAVETHPIHQIKLLEPSEAKGQIKKM